MSEMESDVFSGLVAAAEWLGWRTRVRVEEEAGVCLSQLHTLTATEAPQGKVILCSDGSMAKGVADSGVYSSAGPGIAFHTISEPSI